MKVKIAYTLFVLLCLGMGYFHGKSSAIVDNQLRDQVQHTVSVRE